MRYREIGDVAFGVWDQQLKSVASPMVPWSRQLYDIAQGHTALLLAQLWYEAKYDTVRSRLSALDRNPSNMKWWPEDPKGMPAGATGTKPVGNDQGWYLTFKDYPSAIREWRRRVIDDPDYKSGVYKPTMTLKKYCETYALVTEVHPDSGKDTSDIYPEVRSKLMSLGMWKEEPQMTDKITFGKVPMFGYRDEYLKNKREGFGWDNLGQRRPKFIALHRMLGSMASTKSHFNNPNVSSITDYAIGVEAMDGKAMAGVIYRYNDPLGFRSGWASGPVSAPFGDGKAFVDKYGINAVNRDGISLEISGNQNTPVDAVAWGELVHFCAYWCDFMKIPYTSIPINPATGISAFIWHTEFTAGTGKECPFKWMRDNTNRLIKDVAAFLKKYQTAADAPDVEKPEVPEIPEPAYATPVPVVGLAALGGGRIDANTARHMVIDNANEFVFVGDRVRAIRDTKRLQFADKGAKEVGPVIKAGEEFDVLWSFRAQDGTYYYLTPFWTRVPVEDTERISDAVAAA